MMEILFFIVPIIIFIHVCIHIFKDVSNIEIYYEDDEYCYNCPYGACFEIPYSENCKKWEVDSENKSRKQDKD